VSKLPPSLVRAPKTTRTPMMENRSRVTPVLGWLIALSALVLQSSHAQRCNEGPPTACVKLCFKTYSESESACRDAAKATELGCGVLSKVADAGIAAAGTPSVSAATTANGAVAAVNEVLQNEWAGITNQENTMICKWNAFRQMVSCIAAGQDALVACGAACPEIICTNRMVKVDRFGV
jgi:hypothetical protein